MKPLPMTVDLLLKELDSDYPERSPDPKQNERGIWIDVGKRELVRQLLLRQQTEKDSKLPTVLEKS